MKKFLVQSVFFLLPMLLTAYALDLFISHNLKKSNSHGQKEFPVWNAVLDGKINADILIYGSSRAWTQVNVSMVEDRLKMPVYNLGIDGHNFWLQYLRHRLFLKNNPKPKLIVHIVDIGTLPKRSDLYNANQFLPYMLWNRDIKEATIGYEGYKLADYYLPLVRYYGKTDALLSTMKVLLRPKTNIVQRIKGYQPHDTIWSGDFDRAKATMKSLDAKVDPPSFKLFDQYLNECRLNKIAVILVYPPEYFEGQLFVRNRGAIINLYKNLSRKYRIPFYDFSKDSLCFDKKYFYNATHLNKTGAELFTAKLIDSINNKSYR